MLVKFRSELRATPSGETIAQTPRWCKFNKICSMTVLQCYHSRSLWWWHLYTSSQKNKISRLPTWNLYPLHNLKCLKIVAVATSLLLQSQYMTWDSSFYLCTMPCVMPHMAGTKACHWNVWHRKLSLLGSCLWWKCLGTIGEGIPKWYHLVIWCLFLQGSSKRQTIACLQ